MSVLLLCYKKYHFEYYPYVCTSSCLMGCMCILLRFYNNDFSLMRYYTRI